MINSTPDQIHDFLHFLSKQVCYFSGKTLTRHWISYKAHVYINIIEKKEHIEYKDEMLRAWRISWRVHFNYIFSFKFNQNAKIA